MVWDMKIRVWRAGIVLFVLLGRITCDDDPIRASLLDVCPVESVADSILGFRDSNCIRNDGEAFDVIGVIEGDELSLQRALNMVHKNSHEYVSVLFYASWCLFSRACRPHFSILSSLYPSISHFAIEESSIRPSILSKYGVHGFPTLFLINSTMRVRYHGSRTIGSLVAFYTDVTGIKTVPYDSKSFNQIGSQSNEDKHYTNEQESCPFTWARFPVNMLRQETYLALATTFVLLRLLYYIFPALNAFVQFTWRRHIRNVCLGGLWDHPQAYLTRAIQLFNSLKDPCKRSNLQEGTMNARAWASKSLASVSIGDASTSRAALATQRH